jgi:hypothetical protein
MALTKLTDFIAANPEKALQMASACLVLKGNSDNDLYISECDPASGTLLTTGSGLGTAPVEWGDFVASNEDTSRQVKPICLVAKSNADNDFYLTEIDTGTGEIQTS